MRRYTSLLLVMVWLGATSCSNTSSSTASIAKETQPVEKETVSHDVPFQNEPDGFRGMRWGAARSAFSGLAPFVTSGLLGAQLYTRSKEDLSLGTVKVTSIGYLFRGDKFEGVMVLFPNSSWNEMKNQLYVRYGGPTLVNGDGHYTWKGPTGTVVLSPRDEGGGLGSLQICSSASMKLADAAMTEQMNKGF